VITDIKKGLGVFTPKPEGTVSFDALKQTLKKAGYTLASADITIIGKLMRENDKWVIVSEQSGQTFRLEGKTIKGLLAKSKPDSVIEITGNWKSLSEASATSEIVEPQTVKKVEAKTGGMVKDVSYNRKPDVKYINANFLSSSIPESPKVLNEAKRALAPIRTTTPGLTVYQGGAITPRFYFIKQHLGDLDVNRQVLDISLSYTPTPKLQLEVEVPISRTTFDDGEISGLGVGLGNITLWSKYRFFRTVKTYGDRQAAIRLAWNFQPVKKMLQTSKR